MRKNSSNDDQDESCLEVDFEVTKLTTEASNTQLRPLFRHLACQVDETDVY